MHAVFNWEYHEGPSPIPDIIEKVRAVFEGRERIRHLHRTTVITVRSGQDFLELNAQLSDIADAHEKQFYYAFYALAKGSMYRGVPPSEFDSTPGPHPVVVVDDRPPPNEFWNTDASEADVMGERAVEPR